MTPADAEKALRTLIQDARLAHCRILSEGDACDCALCLLDILCDRNSAELIELRRIRAGVKDVIDHGVPRPPGGQQVGPQKYQMTISTAKALRYVIGDCDA